MIHLKLSETCSCTEPEEVKTQEPQPKVELPSSPYLPSFASKMMGHETRASMVCRMPKLIQSHSCLSLSNMASNIDTLVFILFVTDSISSLYLEKTDSITPNNLSDI